MNKRLKRNVALGAAGVLAVAGGGVAVAATSATDPRDAVLADAAKRLNVSPEQLRAALDDAFAAQLDKAVEAGKLTRQQADRIEQGAKRGGGVPLLGPPPGAVHRGFLAPPGASLDAAAEYLDLTPRQLGERLRDGTSLADVAKARGKSVAGLEDALVAAAKEDLDKAVEDGRLTNRQRDALLKRLEAHVSDLVQGQALRLGPGPCGPGFGPPPPGRGRRGSSTAPGAFVAPAPAPAWG